MDGGRDGAGATGAGLRGERTGGAPLLDIAVDAVEADVVAVGNDGVGAPLFDCLNDALAEILGICFHGLSITPPQ
jgi:hypothetical protein